MKENGFFKFIIILIITALLVAGGVIVYLIYNESESASSSDIVSDTAAETTSEAFFVATADGTEITGTHSFMLPARQPYELTVKGDIDVRIVANVLKESNNFEFRHNGRRKQFFAETNLLSAFNIERDGETFRLSLKEGCFTIKGILEKIYEGETIEMPAALEQTNEQIFSIVIKEKGKIVSRTMYFGIEKAVLSVGIEPARIVF